MAIPSYRRDLFRDSTIGDILNFFHLLFNARELTADLTLALLKIIHHELNIHQKPDRTVYKRYAEAIESLRYYVPDMLQQVVDGWKSSQNPIPTDWFDNGVSKKEDDSKALG